MNLFELSELSAKEIIAGLKKKQFSVLKIAHCNKLRAEMKGPGFACRAVLRLCGAYRARSYRDFRHVRERICKLLIWGAPCDFKYESKPHFSSDRCLVLGFNHPSLGEIVRFVCYHMQYLEDRYSLFPVNLPWYEALAPASDVLHSLGIIIVPIITPSTAEKMKLNLDENERQALHTIASAFSTHYVAKIHELVTSGDMCAIWVAPSATRQATVFKTYSMYVGTARTEPQTMTLLATAMTREHMPDKYSFVPVSVHPGRGCNRGLNLWKNMRIRFGKGIGGATVEKILRLKSEHYRGRIFEHEFLIEICSLLAQDCKNSADISMFAPPLEDNG